MEEMRKGMLTLKEENRKLRQELEQIKDNVKTQSCPTKQRNDNETIQVIKEIKKHIGKDKQKETNKISESMSSKKTSLSGISTENKEKNTQARRELRYMTDIRRTIPIQTKTIETQKNTDNVKRKGSSQKKRAERLNSVEYSSRKKKNSEKQQMEEGGRNQSELVEGHRKKREETEHEKRGRTKGQ